MIQTRNFLARNKSDFIHMRRTLTVNWNIFPQGIGYSDHSLYYPKLRLNWTAVILNLMQKPEGSSFGESVRTDLPVQERFIPKALGRFAPSTASGACTRPLSVCGMTRNLSHTTARETGIQPTPDYAREDKYPGLGENGSPATACGCTRRSSAACNAVTEPRRPPRKKGRRYSRASTCFSRLLFLLAALFL